MPKRNDPKKRMKKTRAWSPNGYMLFAKDYRTEWSRGHRPGSLSFEMIGEAYRASDKKARYGEAAKDIREWVNKSKKEDAGKDALKKWMGLMNRYPWSNKR